MKFSKILFIIIFLTVNFFIFPLKSEAQVPGEGLTISPPLFELTINPGQTTDQTIKITNPTEKLMEVYPLMMNFRAKGEGGEPDFYSANDQEANFSLAHWIKYSQTKLALTPEQVVNFNYQIQVPKDAEPGGHYGVVFFATEPPELEEDVSKVAIASMIGSLVLIKVPGDIIEEGNLEEFTSKKFYFKPPVNFIIKIANSGNVHFKPQGEITIKNWQGKVLDKVVVNETKGNVLPESIRKFEEQWAQSSPFWKTPIGKFSADLKIVYGDSEKTFTDKLVFWIIPWWIIGAAIVIIVVIIGLIVWRRKKRKRKQKKLSKAKSRLKSGTKKVFVDTLKR